VSRWKSTRAVASRRPSGDHVIPARSAVAEERGLDGRRLLEASSPATRSARGSAGATTARANVHSHGTWGTISTAVAIAKLDGASAETVRAVMKSGRLDEPGEPRGRSRAHGATPQFERPSASTVSPRLIGGGQIQARRGATVSALAPSSFAIATAVLIVPPRAVRNGTFARAVVAPPIREPTS